MTNAAAPAVVGEASLVPPKASIGVGSAGFWSLKQSVNRVALMEQIPQPKSAGAITSTVRAFLCANPPELILETLLSMNPWLVLKGMMPSPVCAYRRNVVDPPTAIELAEVAGEPIVPAVPASPVLTTTVTPLATAASLASEMGSFVLSGNGLPPNDS